MQRPQSDVAADDASLGVAHEEDASEWETKALDLAERFIKNFAKYEGNAAGKALVSAGPQK